VRTIAAPLLHVSKGKMRERLALEQWVTFTTAVAPEAL